MIIKCEERYQEAKAFAEKTGDNTLQNCLERLTKWEENNDSTIYLCKYIMEIPMSQGLLRLIRLKAGRPIHKH